MLSQAHLTISPLKFPTSCPFRNCDMTDTKRNHGIATSVQIFVSFRGLSAAVLTFVGSITFFHRSVGCDAVA